MKNRYVLYVFGFMMLLASKIRNNIFGYRTPKIIPDDKVAECVGYDIKMVDSWIKNIDSFTEKHEYIKDKNVLELGPGSDIGAGLLLLSKGAKSYTAFDVNKLISCNDRPLYDGILRYIRTISGDAMYNYLNDAIKCMCLSQNGVLRYVVNKNFDLMQSFNKSEFDVVFSQAAFEHFESIEDVIKGLSKVCSKGSVLVTEIDFKSHSRWIRDIDPNNIYRFSDMIYDLLKANGIPNRERPYRYEEILRSNGWSDVQIIPIEVTENGHVDKYYSGFNDSINQMNILSVVLYAKKE